MYFQLYLFTFSGESKCGLELCEKLYELFRAESIQATFTLQIPLPQDIINEEVLQHVNPGQTPEEQKYRKYKSMFIPPYDDPHFLHHAVNECIKPIREGVEDLSKYLVHSINMYTQADSWAFLFKYKGDGNFDARNPGFGKVLLPEGKIGYQQEILIIFCVHQFINMFPAGMLFEADGKTKAGILMHCWNESVLKRRHAHKKNKEAWRDAFDDWYKNWDNRVQNCAVLWEKSKDDEEKDIESGRKRWIECLHFWEGVRRQIEEESEEEEESSSENEEFGSEGEAESKEEEKSREKSRSEGEAESEQEETSEELISQARGESEGFTARREERNCESSNSETHSSEYSERMSGDISSTEDKREETESSNDATERDKESEGRISQNKRRRGEETSDIPSSKRSRGDKIFPTEGET